MSSGTSPPAALAFSYRARSWSVYSVDAPVASAVLPPVDPEAVALFPLALAGALLGFLPFNFAPARIFLGSAGAFFLGFQLAVLSILAPAKIATALLVMAVPILDVAWQIYSRLRRRRSPFHGDRGHLHYRLADAGLSTRQIVLTYYAVAVVFGLAAIFGAALTKLLMLAALSLGSR